MLAIALPASGPWAKYRRDNRGARRSFDERNQFRDCMLRAASLVRHDQKQLAPVRHDRGGSCERRGCQYQSETTDGHPTYSSVVSHLVVIA